MKTKFVFAVILAAVVMFGAGCSSVEARSGPRQTKLYPGVQQSLDNGNGGTSDSLDAALAYFWWADLLLSAGVDTALLPVDLAYKPSTPEPPRYTPGTFRGVYRFGPERSEFIANDSRERWWLDGNIDDLRRRMVRPSAEEPAELQSPVALVVEGELSERGRYGHMDGYQRELRVTRIVEVKQMPADKRR